MWCLVPPVLNMNAFTDPIDACHQYNTMKFLVSPCRRAGPNIKIYYKFNIFNKSCIIWSQRIVDVREVTLWWSFSIMNTFFINLKLISTYSQTQTRGLVFDEYTLTLYHSNVLRRRKKNIIFKLIKLLNF